jgi:hypothetical protein
MNTSTAASPLLFSWAGPRRRSRALIGFLIASFFAHVGCFYLFQIVYPPTVSLTPAPQRVNLISANSDEGATLLRWVDAEDPALASTTRRPSDARRYLLGKIEHVPSYSSIEPMLQAAPPLNVDLRIPSAQPIGPVPIFATSSQKPLGPVPTRVIFSRELEPLGQPNFVPTNFKASGKEPPQNGQFRIAVDSRGVVRYCFPLNSSGDTALDDQARQHLVLCRFTGRSTSSDDALVWGIATMEWGNDVAAPNAKPTPSAP